MRRIFLVLAMLGALLPMALSTPAAQAQVGNTNPLPISEVAMDTWGVGNLDPSSILPDWDVLVWDFAEINGVMYVGGRFTTVSAGNGQTDFSQPYLAAFDVSTGSWINSFAPQLDGPVYALSVAPDGNLLVGGEFTSVNGAANTSAFAALDTNGAVVTSWSRSVTSTVGVAAVLDIEISGNDVYIGGDFTHVLAADGTNVRKYNVARIQNGTLDQAFDTRATGGRVYAMSVPPDASALYLGGSFGNLNASTGTNWFGGVALPAGSTVLVNPDPIPQAQNRLVFDLYATNTDVWIGTESHILYVLDTNTLVESARYQTKGFGGDTQAFFQSGNIIYVGGHGHGFIEKLRDPNAWPDRQIQWLTAFDATTGQHIDGHFPRLSMSDGIWALIVDSEGKLWAGGDPSRDNGSALSGFAVYPLDSATDPVDLARGQASTQSSSGPTNMRWGDLNPNGTPKTPENSCPGIAVGAANLANDGKVAGGARECSFSTTQTQADPWWEVDLGSTQDVDIVRLWNLQNSERDFFTFEYWYQELNNVYVYVSDTPFVGNTLADMQVQAGVDIYQINGTVTEFGEVAPNRDGRYVRVQLTGPSRTLRLAEVEILDIIGDPPPGGGLACTVTNNANGSVTVSWTNIGANGYDLIQDGGAPAWITSTSLVDFSPGTTYTITGWGNGANGMSTSCTNPNPPGGGGGFTCTVTNNANGSVDVSWDNIGANGYDLSEDGSSARWVTGTFSVDVSPGVTYQVTAWGNGTNGETTTCTNPNPGGGGGFVCTVTNNVNGSATISWDDIGANGYDLSKDGGAAIWVNNTSSVDFTPGMSYSVTAWGNGTGGTNTTCTNPNPGGGGFICTVNLNPNGTIKVQWNDIGANGYDLSQDGGAPVWVGSTFYVHTPPAGTYTVTAWGNGTNGNTTTC